jgi:O-antigen ligase
VDTITRWPENVSTSLAFTAAALVAAAMLGVMLPLVGLSQLRLVAAAAVALVGAGMLLVRPGIMAALFLSVGLFKADPTISGIVPFDLTGAIAALLVLACVVKLFRTGELPVLPRAYVLYLPLLLMTLGSLLYTPSLGLGADKAMKFVMLTGIGVVCPFILFDSPKQVRVFLYTMAILGLILSSEALSGLGGENRLVMPGRLTIQLGTAAGTTIAVALGLALPHLSFWRRVLLYPLVAMAFVALLGSGARGPLIGAVLVVLFALLYFRQLWLDAAILAGVGMVGLAQVGIPAASFNYLGTLWEEDPSAAMATRTPLMEMAWQLFKQHPLLGVGIGGFATYSKDPENTYPHNVFLELGAELGFVALMAFTALVLWALWEAYKQLRDRNFPYRAESAGVFALMLFAMVQMVKSGDINDNRAAWLLMGLPFLLRLLANKKQAAETAVDAATPAVMTS